MFRSGDPVAVREIWKGRVWKARACVVVHDRADQLALYLPQGAPTKIPTGSGIPRDEWTLEDGEFAHDALRLARPGAAHSVLLFWDSGRFVGWYVNFERPLTRSQVGFDYLDQELDLRVRPDRSVEVLDEDEFEVAQRLSVISPAEAASVRDEAERAIEAIERWEPPFCDGWETWRPDPAWAIPFLPEGWDRV